MQIALTLSFCNTVYTLYVEFRKVFVSLVFYALNRFRLNTVFRVDRKPQHFNTYLNYNFYTDILHKETVDYHRVSPL